MLMRSLGVAAAALLVGCVTAGDMRKRPADFERTSQKSISEISGCLGTNWAGKTSMAISSVPAPNGGYTFTSAYDGQTNILLDLSDEGQQRRVRLYFRQFPVSFIDEKAHARMVESCL